MNMLLTSLWLIGMTLGGASLGYYCGDPYAQMFWTFVGGIIGFIMSLAIRFGVGGGNGSGDSGWDGFSSFDGFSCDSGSDSSSSSCD